MVDHEFVITSCKLNSLSNIFKFATKFKYMHDTAYNPLPEPGSMFPTISNGVRSLQHMIFANFAKLGDSVLIFFVSVIDFDISIFRDAI